MPTNPSGRYDIDAWDSIASVLSDGIPEISGDKQSLQEQRIYVYSESGGYLTSIDPAATSTPVQDALDHAANNGGGKIVLPPGGTVQDTGPVQLHDNVDIDGNRCTIEITGDGNDGLLVDNAESLTTGYLQADIRGTLAVEHVNGDNGNTGVGLHLVSGVSNSEWGHIRLTGWNGRAVYEESNVASFQWTINHLYASNVDAGDANGVYDWQGGGAPCQINYVTAYPTDTGSASDSHIVRTDAKSLNIGVLNVGGTAAQAVRANTAGINGIHVGHINFEPGSQNSTPSAVVFSNGINPTRIGSVRISNGVTVDYVFAQYSAANNYWGTVRNMGTINSGHLDNRNDTNGTVIFEGQSANVVDNSGVTLTVPIAALGDLATVS